MITRDASRTLLSKLSRATRFLPGLLVLAGPLCASSGLDALGFIKPEAGEATSHFAWTRLDSGVQVRTGGIAKNLLFYGPNIVRVNAIPGPNHWTHGSLAVIAKPTAERFAVSETSEALLIKADLLTITVDKRTGALSFQDAAGRLLTREQPDGPCQILPTEVSSAPSYQASNTFELTPDEALYGLGQYDRRYMDYRSQEVLLVQTNIGIVVPFLLSTNRYGILWDYYSKMRFKDGPKGASLWAESAPAGVDYYFVAGTTMDAVIAGYRTLTGQAPLYPKAAFGLFMSKERYQTQDQLVGVVEAFRKDGFPLDYIVQDWQYWGGADDGTWSGMIWNKERYPDPLAMTRRLHDELHVKLMNSIWPSVGNDTALAAELDAQGLRFAPLHWISKKARIYDAFSPEGRRIYFKHIKQGLLDMGVDALWMDGTEVEVGGACHDPGQVEQDIKNLGKNALGDFTRYLNCYSLPTTQGVYEGQREVSDKRVLTLTRSAWAGQQRYAAMPWSGDTTASWEVFRNQIAGGLNVAMSGLPYWTQDTGGFFVNHSGGETNPAYQELYARWNQFAIFNPIYRIHGTSIQREPYRFKETAPEIYQSLRTAAELRYRLLPYIYSLAWKTSAEAYTPMRGLALDFPDDLQLRHLDDTFMFGPAFLVHPVTKAMYHQEPTPAVTIPAVSLRTPDGQPGLFLQYYAGLNFENKAGSTIDTKLEHDWPAPPLANPPPGLDGIENFSARWTGSLIAPESGEYEIGMEYDDGARLFVGTKTLVDDWTIGPKRYQAGRLWLEKGQELPLKAEFKQGAYARYFRLVWRTPSELKALALSDRKIDNAATTLLPSAANWFDFWTGAFFEGGQRVTRACTLDQFPLYVRAGSIVPMGPVLQYATERPEAPYEIRVYPGCDATFTLYEDDNETYAYEKGECATYELNWDDAAKMLYIGERKGAFPGMVKSRELRIRLIGSNPEKEITVTYEGRPLRVVLRD